jgi:hypothetical protein
MLEPLLYSTVYFVQCRDIIEQDVGSGGVKRDMRLEIAKLL